MKWRCSRYVIDRTLVREGVEIGLNLEVQEPNHGGGGEVVFQFCAEFLKGDFDVFFHGAGRNLEFFGDFVDVFVFEAAFGEYSAALGWEGGNGFVDGFAQFVFYIVFPREDAGGFAFAQGWAVAAVYAGLTFCYSALAAVLPAFSTDLFGLPHAGVNYGFLALGQSAGSLLFPLLAEALGLEAGRHLMAVGAAAGGFACIWFLKPAGEKTPQMENGGQKRQKRTKKKNRLDK